MAGRTAVTRIAPLAGLLLLAIGSIAARPVHAAEPEPTAATQEQGSVAWGPIVGACFGVMFGGAIALWQIRGMKNRS